MFRLVEKYRLPDRTHVKAGESIELTLVYEAIALGFAGETGRLFAKDLYGYLKKVMKRIADRKRSKPATRQKVVIRHRSREWDEVIEEVERQNNARR